MNGGLGMRTSKNGKKKRRGTFLTNTNYMLCKNSGSLSMCTPKNKKKEMSGYGRNKIVANATYNENKNEKRTPILRKPQISRYAIGKGHIRKLLRSLTLQPLTPYIPSAPRHNKLLYSLPTTQNTPAGPTTVSCGRQDTVEASQQG